MKCLALELPVNVSYALLPDDVSVLRNDANEGVNTRLSKQRPSEAWIGQDEISRIGGILDSTKTGEFKPVTGQGQGQGSRSRGQGQGSRGPGQTSPPQGAAVTTLGTGITFVPGLATARAAETPVSTPGTGSAFTPPLVAAQAAGLAIRGEEPDDFCRPAGGRGNRETDEVFSNIKRDFNTKWWDESMGYYREDPTQIFVQTLNVLPLASGLVPDNKHAGVQAKLVDDVMKTRAGHEMVGIAGARWIPPVLSQAVQKENRRTLMCFDPTNGKLLWQSGVTYADPEPTQENNPYCSGSPATDGERVYVCFGHDQRPWVADRPCCAPARSLR